MTKDVKTLGVLAVVVAGRYIFPWDEWWAWTSKQADIEAGPGLLILHSWRCSIRLAIPHHRCQRRVVANSMSLIFVAMRQFTN